jgi:hypothetical protein
MSARPVATFVATVAEMNGQRRTMSECTKHRRTPADKASPPGGQEVPGSNPGSPNLKWLVGGLAKESKIARSA